MGGGRKRERAGWESRERVRERERERERRKQFLGQFGLGNNLDQTLRCGVITYKHCCQGPSVRAQVGRKPFLQGVWWAGLPPKILESTIDTLF